MGKLYEVCLVDGTGCPVYGIDQVESDNALNAVEVYLSNSPYIPISSDYKLAVRLPESNLAIAFEVGVIT